MFLILFFIFGSIVGSFLNVVILRYNTGKTLSGRSQCFSCQRKLRWHELLPVVSFLALRGKCRTCRSKISIQYPLVEFLTGVIFALTASKTLSLGVLFSNIDLQPPFYFSHIPIVYTLLTAYYLLLFSFLVVIFVYDLRHKIIPDTFVYLFIILSPLSLFLDQSSFEFQTVQFWDVLAGPLLFLPFFLMWFFSSGRWMGLGDGKLAWGIGWFLGLERGVSAILFAFWLGAAVSLSLLFLSCVRRASLFRRYSLFPAFKNLTIKSEVPFAPFLIIGMWIVFFFNLSLTGIFASL